MSSDPRSWRLAAEQDFERSPCSYGWSQVALPSKICIWGVCEASRVAFGLARRAGIEVEAFIDSFANGQHCGLPIVRPTDFRSSSVAVLICAHSKSGALRFEEISDYIGSLDNFVETRLLHPVVLLEQFTHSFSDVTVVNSLPGCGNGITSRLVVKLLDSVDSSMGEESALWRNWAEHFRGYIDRVSESLFGGWGWRKVVVNYAKYLDGTHPNCLCASGDFTLDRLPAPVLHLSDVVGGHFHATAFPDSFVDGGGRTIESIRHPLDYLLSRSTKVRPFDVRMEWTKDQPGDSQSKRELSLCRLVDENWVSEVLSEYQEFYISRRNPTALRVRYESLLGGFAAEANRCAAFLGLSPSSEQIAAVRDSVWCRPLFEDFAHHYTRPEAAKWRRHRWPTQIRVHLALIQDLCDQLGYPFELSEMVFEEAVPRYSESTKMVIAGTDRSSRVVGLFDVDGVLFRVNGSSEAVVDEVVERMQSSIAFRSLLSSAGWAGEV